MSSFSQQVPCVTSTRAVMATNQQQQHTYTMCCVCVYMFVGYYLQRRRKALVYCEECGVPDIALGSFLRSNYSLGLVVTWGEWLPVRVFGVACIYCCSFCHNVIGLLSDCSLGCVVHKWPNARQPNIPAYMPSRSLATHARTHTRCCWIVYMGVYTHAYTCTYITYTHTHANKAEQCILCFGFSWEKSAFIPVALKLYASNPAPPAYISHHRDDDDDR